MRVYCLKTLKKLSIYPLGNTPSAPSEEIAVNEGSGEKLEVEENKVAIPCERASCYAHANLPRTVPKSYWSWPVAICKGSVPTCTVVSPNTRGVHVPQHLYACLTKTEVPD